MRGVWQQASRPKLNFTTARTSIRSTFGRRSATRHGNGNKIAACDIFAAFLAPLLAAAAFADTSWKDSKRKEWERRFKEINDEVERLRAREVEVWNRIQHRSVRRGALCQRRMYSTTVNTIAWDRADTEEWGDAFEQEAAESPPEPPIPTDVDASISSPNVLSEQRPKQSSPEQIPEYESLLTQRLILRLLLYIYSDHDPLYEDRWTLRTERRPPPEDIGQIALRLQTVTQKLHDLRHHASLNRPLTCQGDRSEIPDLLMSRSPDSDKKLQKLCEDYLDQKIDTRAVVEWVVEWLLAEPERCRGTQRYLSLLVFFTRCRLDQLANYVISALWQSGYEMGPTYTAAILEHTSRLQNMRIFKWLLSNLTSPDEPTRRGQKAWEWLRVDDTLIPAPPTFHSFTYRALIRASINFGQIDRADAYYKLAHRCVWQSHDDSYVIKAYLQYSALNLDWTLGQIWIGRMLKRIVHDDPPSRPPSLFLRERAITAMGLRAADLFIACEKEDMFNAWIDLLAKHGVQPGVIRPIRSKKKERNESIRWIGEKWRHSLEFDHENPPPLSIDSYSAFQEDVRHFGESFGLHKTHEDDVISSDLERVDVGTESTAEHISDLPMIDSAELQTRSREASLAHRSPTAAWVTQGKQLVEPSSGANHKATKVTSREASEVQSSTRTASATQGEGIMPSYSIFDPEFAETMERIKNEGKTLAEERLVQERQMQAALDKIRSLEKEAQALRIRLGDTNGDVQSQGEAEGVTSDAPASLAALSMKTEQQVGDNELASVGPHPQQLDLYEAESTTRSPTGAIEDDSDSGYDSPDELPQPDADALNIGLAHGKSTSRTGQHY